VLTPSRTSASGTALANVASVEALKRALLAADTVVYNLASTGIYLDKLFANWGILDQLKAKTTRYANGESVMELLRDLHRAGSTICMVTHDPRFARYADRSIHLFDGRVVDEKETR